MRRELFLLLCLVLSELIPNLVAEDFLPTYERSGDWKLPSQGLKGGVRHGPVVFGYGFVIIVFGV